MKTYHRHLLGQWIYNFLLAFCILNLLLLIGNLVRYGSKVGVSHILPMLPALLPSMLVYSIPMAALTSTISTLARARQLNEPITLASSGIGIFQLLPPFAFIGLALSCITAMSFQWLQPWGEAYKHHYLSNLGASILETELNKPQATLNFGNRTINVFDRGDEKRSAVLQIREDDGSIQREIFAVDASVDIDRDSKEITLATHGKIHLINYDGEHFGHGQTTHFPETRFNYPERFSGEISLRQWPLSKMWRALKDGAHPRWTKIQAYFHEKICLLISPILLVFAAFPLGFAGKGSSRFTGFLLGLGLIFLIYYPLLIFGKQLIAAQAPLGPLWMQLPNLALLILGFWGCRRIEGRI